MKEEPICTKCGQHAKFYGYYYKHENGEAWCDSCWREMKKDEHPKDKPLFVQHIPGFAFPSDAKVFNFKNADELIAKVKSHFGNWFEDGYELCREDCSIMAHNDQKQTWWVLGNVSKGVDLSSIGEWKRGADGKYHVFHKKQRPQYIPYIDISKINGSETHEWRRIDKTEMTFNPDGTVDIKERVKGD